MFEFTNIKSDRYQINDSMGLFCIQILKINSDLHQQVSKLIKILLIINSKVQFKDQPMSSLKPSPLKQTLFTLNLNSKHKSSHQESYEAFSKHKTTPRYSLRYQCILIILVLAFFSHIPKATCFNLAVTSSSNFTGISASYFFTVTSHNNPTNLILTFSDWSPNLAQPFVSSFNVAENSTGNSLSCINRISKTIECNISASLFPGSVYPAQIVLRMNGISNPSSLKPYSMSLFLNGTGGGITRTATLTVTEPRTSNMIIDFYSYDVGKKSSALLYLTFRNYLASTTFLSITYNSLLTTIDMNSDSAYFIASDSVGLKRLTNWENPSQSFRTLRMNVTNPNFAIPVTIEAIQYFIEGGVEYRIEKFTLTLQITAVLYAQMTAVSPQNAIRFGTNDNTLSMSSRCEIGALNGPAKNAYYQITYDNTVINLLTGTTCVSSSTSGSVSVCTVNIPANTANATNSFSLTKIKSLIPANALISSTVLKIQSWSYFSTLSQFYATCSSSLTIEVQPQVLSPMTSFSGCSQVVGQTNTLVLQVNVENAIVSDVLVLKGYPGKIINRTGSVVTNFNSALNQYEAVLSSTQVINATRVRFTVSFSNPTFLPSQQPSMQILLMRKLSSNNGSLNVYASVSTSFAVCPVTSVLSNSANIPLALSNSITYTSNVAYSFQFTGTSIQFKDYALNDYFVVSFKNRVTDGTNFADTDSPFQLSSFSASSSPQVLINSQYSLASQILTPFSLKVRLNSSSAVNLVNDPNAASVLLTIKQLSNPFFQSSVFCWISTYNSANLQKQSLSTQLSPILLGYNELSIQPSGMISLLESNNTISLRITSLSQKAVLKASYASISGLYIVVQAPFSCLNTDSNNQIVYTLPAMNTTEISIILNNCTLGYFTDFSKSIQVQEYARFSHTNLTQQIKTTLNAYLIRSTCGDQCRLCDLNTFKCQQCFNSTYSIFNFYSAIDNKCYSTCPSGTYQSDSQCLSCHPICATCTSANFSSCTSCAANFVKGSSGICESTCGLQMFSDNGKCSACDPNCQGCLSDKICYNCKQGAVLMNSQCQFSQCTLPCSTCKGSADFCLTCVSSSVHDYYFYENNCVQTCPEGSFKWENESNDLHPRVCMKVQSSNIYFVGSILGLISLSVGIGIRCCARKKTKISSDERDALIRTTKLSNALNESYGLKSQQNINKTQVGSIPPQTFVQNILKQYFQSPKTKIYKLNLLRFMTVMMGYIEVVCVVVILIQGGIYNPKGVNEMIYVGLAGLFVTNIVFGMRYFIRVYLKLSQKRQKFIEMNLKRKSIKIQIEPQVIKQPVQEEKSDENNQENEQNKENEGNVQKKEDQVNKQDKQNLGNPQSQQVNEKKDANEAKQIKQTKSIKSVHQIKQTVPMRNNQTAKNATVESERSSEFYDDSPEEQQRLKMNKKLLSDFDDQMVKQLVISILSTIFTLRTYNIMRSNLFMIFTNQSNEPDKNLDQIQSLNLSKSPRADANSNMALNLPRRNNEVTDITKTEVLGTKHNSPMKKNPKQSGFNVIKIQPKEIKPQLNKRQSQRKKPAQTQSTNKLPQNLINSIRPFSTEQQPSKNPLLEIKDEYVSKFLHPFYTYIVFASIFLVSLMFAIAAAILIFNKRYENMMLWGIDALILIGISFFLNIFDLWKAVNLSKHQQHSEVSSAAQDVNQTMENIKPYEEDGDNYNLRVMKEEQDVNNLNATKKISSSKKYSNTKGGLSPSKNNPSQMKGSIRQEQIEIDPFSKAKSAKSPSQKSQKTKAYGSIKKSPNKSLGKTSYPEEKPPQLKIFDDLEMDEDNVGRFTKAQKLPKELNRKAQFNSGKVRSSNRSLNGRKTEISSQMNPQTARGKKGKNYKLEDIYLGFLEHQEEQSVPREQDENKQSEEDDEIITVKIESRQKLQSIKQSSVINMKSEEEIGERDWKQKPLRLIEKQQKGAKSDEQIEEQK